MSGIWSQGEHYQRYMGRWSSLVAERFVEWLHLPDDLRWVDAGCGTGALTQAVLAQAAPSSVLAVDLSEGQLDEARRRVEDPRVRFEVTSAADLPPRVADVVVSGLMLNFVPDPLATVSAMARAAPGGTVAAYVWDYAGRMQLLRTFWDVAAALDATVIDQDEAQRFPLCEPDALQDLWTRAGLSEVQTAGPEVTMEFADFDDVWSPFLLGEGPAPRYVVRLGDQARERLRAELERMLHPDPDGRIRLHARAWAVRGHAD